MNWKNRLTNYNFWISLVSAVLLIMQAFNFEFDIANLSEIATALLGLLVVIGIISNPTKSSKETKIEESKESSTKEQDDKVEQNNDTFKDMKESIDSMPSGKQNENNCSSCENDFQVLIDKISSDISKQTGIMKNDITDVVNELIKTYEEGEFMLETENKEVEESIGTLSNEEIEEIAEELLEKEDFEINQEFAQEINDEYNEYKNEVEKTEENLVEEKIELLINGEQEEVEIEAVVDLTEVKEEEIVQNNIDIIDRDTCNEQEDIQTSVEEEIYAETESSGNVLQETKNKENIEENIISFKIVN